LDAIGVSQEEIVSAIKNAEALDPDGLRMARHYENDVVRLFWPAHDEQVGYSVPYIGLYGKLIFRPAELTLWSGSSGSGKSQLISDCLLKWIQEGSRVCLASLEMKPQWTLKRMAKQAGGVERPTAQYIHEIMNYLDTGLLLYECVGKASVEALLEIFDYARAKYGCDQFVIDSLMRLGIAGDDYTGQERAVFRMVDWAVTNNVHLHLVAHSRKAGQNQTVPEGEDVKGPMELVANAFNVITVWRNRKREEVVDASGDRPAFTDLPGVVMNVAKQRNGDYEGKVEMYFNCQTYQYFSTADNRKFPRCYVDKTEDVEKMVHEVQ
jgi:twinkle protein